MTEPKTTRKGTPCAQSWDDAWVARVNESESSHGRRICGARTMAGTPCSLGSTHASGRCRFHGGFDLTGAPAGNRNAVMHGLYSRRLQICGTHCARWQSCPMAGADVLKLPPPQRPTCPYEQVEYNAVVTDGQARLNQLPEPDPRLPHLLHLVALLQVMVSRAANALSVASFVDTTAVKSTNYEMESKKLSPALHAFEVLSREFRRYEALFERRLDGAEEYRALNVHHESPMLLDRIKVNTERQQADIDLDPDVQAQLVPPMDPITHYTTRLVDKAKDHARDGDPHKLHDTFRSLHALDPGAVSRELDSIFAEYDPPSKKFSAEAVRKKVLEAYGEP